MGRKAPKQRILVLIRHAHRDKSRGADHDNGLSPKGRRQVKRLLAFFEASALAGSEPLFLTSPKQRCVETIKPLAKLAGAKPFVEPLLDEGGDLKRKLSRFIGWWRKQGPEVTLACSHGDWIPACIRALTGAEAELGKSGWCEIREAAPGTARLEWLLQDFAFSTKTRR